MNYWLQQSSLLQHPRLSAIEHTGKNGTPLQSGVLLVPGLMDIEEWEKAALAKPAA